MPLTSPAYPIGPYRFRDREYLVITYRTDPQKLRALVPEPLEVPEPLVKFAELPVLEVVSATHFVTDLTLGLGTVVHDYLAESGVSARQGRVREFA
jgi:acetoacetate decarboxylase